MKVIPLIGGYLPVPSVTLMHYRSTQTPTSNGKCRESSSCLHKCTVIPVVSGNTVDAWATYLVI